MWTGFLRQQSRRSTAVFVRCPALAVGEAVATAGTPPSTTSLLPEGAAVDKLTLNLLDKEVARLRALIGVDAENAKAFARLSEKISRDEAALAEARPPY